MGSPFDLKNTPPIPVTRAIDPFLNGAQVMAINQRGGVRPLAELIAEVDRYTEHEMDKLTGEILKSRTRIYHILDKLSIGIDDIDVRYPILKQGTHIRTPPSLE